jgi:methionine synthase I (cobalamin-dependent)
VDLVLVETMTDLAEAILAVEAAVEAASEAAPGTSLVPPAPVPVIATMTFEETARGFFTIMGADIATAARKLAAAGAEAIGSNCGNGSERMVAIAREFRRSTDLPLVIQSNAGLPVISGERVVYPESPAYMGEKAREWIAAGAAIIGGCCGTTPDHVRALRASADEARASRA